MSIFSWFKPKPAPVVAPQFSFCENQAAGSHSRWHIRPLTEAGQKLGGGADTLALCGREVHWDVKCAVTPTLLNREAVCAACSKAYLEAL